jgi:hypothetical protein
VTTSLDPEVKYTYMYSSFPNSLINLQKKFFTWKLDSGL